MLSGGRYDQLIGRMGKRVGGIGFAVYLDQLGRKGQKEKEEEALLLYDENVSPEQVIRTVSVLKQDGLQVRADRVIPGDRIYGKILRLSESGVTEVE